MRSCKNEKIISEADYIIKNKCILAQVAEEYGVNLSTIYTDMTKRLKDIDTIKFEEVRIILKGNLKKGQSNGGKKTREKYGRLTPDINLTSDVLKNYINSGYTKHEISVLMNMSLYTLNKIIKG